MQACLFLQADEWRIPLSTTLKLQRELSRVKRERVLSVLSVLMRVQNTFMLMRR